MDFVRVSLPSSMLAKNHHNRPEFQFGANLHRRLVVRIERNDSEMSVLVRLPCSHH